ncbi:16S rRNA (cytosine(1402)-N(4))-methyltransferase RsmH [bacterium]|nr:16S rRNA (cytosine(1402)-N(4))-methyltransferase RsmH [bacterium]MBU1064496.1 16S rRNA (cytosine(1402)-N(4))-methyltransferase RsmH [bacterium]MBU1635443.1 16S rRNA (cytosine(1402)-N(4))-methyltransferase RsmH [bacterium]MBU1873122.1 16S rRNA (cytosine(1402)-N(4))-methyltransferase RsmH [bacterium]
MSTIHVPVLLKETMQVLVSRPDGVYVDATLGTGGHFRELSSQLDRSAILLGIDADPTVIDHCKSNLNISQKHVYINSNFESIKALCFRNGYPKVDGILMDLGLSSYALDDPLRGLSFSADGPLDMRFSPAIGQTAANIINYADLTDLIQIFQDFGEERFSKSIARSIVKERQKSAIETTGRLAAIVKQKAQAQYVNKTLSRIFQALRIAVNRELDVLQKALVDSVSILNPEGRLVVITYHSLEDRIVKQFFKHESTSCICPREFPICQCDHKASLKIITPKPILPNKEEIVQNSRARSAKLRAAKRL